MWATTFKQTSYVLKVAIVLNYYTVFFKLTYFKRFDYSAMDLEYADQKVNKLLLK